VADGAVAVIEAADGVVQTVIGAADHDIEKCGSHQIFEA